MIDTTITCSDIRERFADLYRAGQFVTDKSGCKMLEIVGASFLADDDHIFCLPNHSYIKREIEWYESMSRDVSDIPGGPPEIWKRVADKNGMINSNYGWCLFSPENFCQFDRVIDALEKNSYTRQAVAIYTRPTMHADYAAHGRSDFMCTNVHQYVIRDNKLHVIVQMRSNDVVFGYRNDYAWAVHAQELVLDALVQTMGDDAPECGEVIWQVGSLHVYERDFRFIEHFIETGETYIPPTSQVESLNVLKQAS